MVRREVVPLEMELDLVQAYAWAHMSKSHHSKFHSRIRHNGNTLNKYQPRTSCKEDDVGHNLVEVLAARLGNEGTVGVQSP